MMALGVMVVNQLSEVLTNGLAGLEEFPKQNASLLTERVVSSILIIGLVILHQPLWMFIPVVLVGLSASRPPLVAAVIC